MTITALAFFALTYFLIAAVPGPSVAALVSRVLARGRENLWPFLLAMWVGEVIWLTLVAYGLGALGQAFQPVFLVLKWTGVVYLIYLAWSMWRSPPVMVEGAELPKATGPFRMFYAGLAITLGNPKIMLFYVALLPTVIDLHHMTVTIWGSLAAIIVLILIAIDLTWVFLAVQAKRFLTSKRAVNAANKTSAGLIAGVAGFIAAQ